LTLLKLSSSSKGKIPPFKDTPPIRNFGVSNDLLAVPYRGSGERAGKWKHAGETVKLGSWFNILQRKPDPTLLFPTVGFLPVCHAWHHPTASLLVRFILPSPIFIADLGLSLRLRFSRGLGGGGCCSPSIPPFPKISWFVTFDHPVKNDIMPLFRFFVRGYVGASGRVRRCVCVCVCGCVWGGMWVHTGV